MLEREREKVTVLTAVNAPVEKAWNYFTKPEYVMQWNHASDDWHSPRGQSDLRPGGVFSFRMEAKDESEGFDFGGMYDEVVKNERIAYTMGDGRKVIVAFTPRGETTEVTQTFEAEEQNPVEMQRSGWQAILDNFKKCVESAK